MYKSIFTQFIKQTFAVSLILLLISAVNKKSFAQLPDELHITMVKDAMNSDEIVIIFYEGASESYDDYDGLKFTNPTINLSSLSSEGYELAINVYPAFTATTAIPLSVSSSSNGNFTLNFTNFNSFTSLSNLMLYDAYTDSTINVSNDSSYHFSINNSIAGTCGDERFSLTFYSTNYFSRNIVNAETDKILKNITLNRKKNLSNSNTAQVIVYPNPYKDELHILLNENYSSGATIRMTDLSGRTLLIWETQNELYLDLKEEASTVSPGIYFITITSVDGKNKENIKIIKY